MNPLLVLTVCVIIVLYLLHYDNKITCNTSWFFFIPLIWFSIIGSRMLSLWFDIRSDYAGTDLFLEGNAFDRTLFSTLIIIGMLCLWKRHIRLFHVVKNNKWLALFFGYCFISIIWSDYPYISLKRWFKYFGNVVMVLVIITEVDKFEAIKALFRRSSYILMGLSLVLYKYFPNLGRSYHRYSGGLSITGVTTNKNTLGAISMIFSIYYIYEFIYRKDICKNKYNIYAWCVNAIFLMLSLYLLYKSRSVTSYVGFLVGFLLIIISRTEFVKANVDRWGIYVLILLFSGLLLEIFFDPAEYIIQSFGRDLTLTTRTDLWKDVLKFDTNKLIGCGYDSFWLGDRMNYFWEKHWWHPTEAHNGYLEMYVELGILGVILFLVMLWTSFIKIISSIKMNYSENIIKLVFAIIFVIYNVSETAFKGIHFMCFIMFLSIIDLAPKINTTYNTYIRDNNEV